MQQCTQLTGTNPPIGLIRSSEDRILRFTQNRQRQPNALPVLRQLFAEGKAAKACPNSSWFITHPTRSIAHRHGKTVSTPPDPESLRKRAYHTPIKSGDFQGLVAIAGAKHPIPSRTRKLSALAPMVLRLKTWESRSPPDQYIYQNTNRFSLFKTYKKRPA